MPSPRPGEWYLTAHCECGGWIIIQPSQGPTKPIALPATLQLTCDACGKTATYLHEEVRHSRVAQSSEPDDVAR
jgi:hypothetical protein